MKAFNSLVPFLTIIFFCGVVNTSKVQADQPNNAKLKEQFQQILKESVRETKCKGVIACIKTPSFYWVGAEGDSGCGKLKSTDMLRIASMTKTFVSVVVQKLNEEGKLKLDDKITYYLPKSVITNIPYSSEITVRQLLNMTSGIKDYTDLDKYNDAVDKTPYRSPWTPEEILEYVYLEKKAVFAPGHGWDYSNTNYILLDIIVKEVTGTSLAAEIRRIILIPLNLGNIFMEIQETQKGGFGGLLVRGYDKNGKDITKIQDGLGLGDGGLISDADSIARFLQALFIDRVLLDESSIKQMMEFHSKENYGLGLELRKTDFGNALGHSGGSAGFESDMLYFPDKKIIFVLLTNQEDTNICDLVFNRIMKLLLKKDSLTEGIL